MAIGSHPEIGVNFGMLKDMTEDEIDAWWAYMEKYWGENLLAGYATLVHDTNNPYYSEDHRGKQK